MKKRLFFRGVSLCIVSLFWFCRVEAQDAKYFNDRGNELFKQNQYDLAIANYNKAISLDPSYKFAYYNRGVVYGAKNEYDLAIQSYTKTISLDPNYTSAYNNRGNAYREIAKYELALPDFSKAISLNPNYKDAYNGRGLIYMRMGEYSLSVNDYVKAISLDGNYGQAYINIIVPLARQYRFSEATSYYTSYRSKNLVTYIDTDVWAFFKKYIEVVTQNLSINNYTQALANLGVVEIVYKNRGTNINNSQRGSYASILALKGYVLEQLNRLDEAKQTYEQALTINNLQPDVIAALGRLGKKQEIFVQNDNTPPTITIIEPATKRSFSIEDDKTTGTQRIRGKAFDASGIRKLTLNNIPLQVEETGFFETTVTIKEGMNAFTIVALDNHSNTASETVLIDGNKGKPNPQLQTAIIPGNNTQVYHAILIAENNYNDPSIKSLPGTVADMRKIYNLLVNNYNFAPSNTDTLVNATKVTILESLIQIANTLKDNDNLFIFYAGHGQMMIHEEDHSEEGFLVPADAGKNKQSTYISSDDLLRTLKYSKARHILFVADACFAGSLFRDISSEAPVPVEEAYKERSRKVLASGNRQAVPDQSEFIEYLRLALQENHTKYITAEQLIDSFKNQYRATTHLQLQYYPIKNVDDLGGQFVFTRK